jgi:hypothetical protein
MSKEYRRTSGYRNWANKICWGPQIVGDTARMKSGRVYKITEKGWRRVN